MDEPTRPNARTLAAEAGALPPEKRGDFLQTLRATDPDLVAEVETLLGMPPHSTAPAVGHEGLIQTHSEPDDDPDRTLPADTTIAYGGAEHAPSKPAAKVIGGDYEILGELGAGGMGKVYRAHQRSLNREVAIKMIPSRLLHSPERIARFYLEAEAAAGLDHPGIVPVYDVGEDEGIHYYAMAIVEGGSLADHASKQRRLPHRRVAEVMEQAARAVQHAHDRAVIHRDIKPANIMLDTQGKPRITDFGLAKVAGGDDLTMAGQVMGTPSYMAPEQAEGVPGAISTRTDVYSLGGTLYALLTGRPPFTAMSVLRTLQKVQKEAPRPLGKDIPTDLGTICQKCLAKSPDERYQSAGALADDLRNYLDGYPISARRVGPAARLVSWAKRNPAIASLTGAVAAALLVGSIVSTAFGIQARRALARADASAQKLEQAIEETLIQTSEGVLANEPRLQKVRETLLASAERYYQDLEAIGYATPQRLADAAYLLGRVRASLNRWDQAEESLSRALNKQEELVRQHPSDSSLMADLALTHNAMAKLCESRWTDDVEVRQDRNASNLADWKEHSQECLAWRKTALDAKPADVSLMRLVANAEMNLGLYYLEAAKTYHKAEDIEQAETLLTSAQGQRSEILSKNPLAYDVVRDSALGLINNADLKNYLASVAKDEDSRTELSREAVQYSTDAAEKLSGLPPSEQTPDTIWRLANCYQVCARGCFYLGDVNAAIENFRLMSSVTQRLVLRMPHVLQYRFSLAEARFNLAQLLLSTQQDSGYAEFAACQQTLADTIIAAPDQPAAVTLLVDQTTYVAKELASRGLDDTALSQVQRAIDLLQALPAEELQFSQATRQRVDGALSSLNELSGSLVSEPSL